MSKHPLDPLLKPGSIALLGASDRSGSPGNVLASQVINSEYPGEVYPVNPRYSKILDRDCYPMLDDLPVTVDQVVIALGNEQLEAALHAAIEHGAKAVTIYSSAILEQDSDPVLQARLAQMTKAAGLAVCGANGMGFYNLEQALYAGIFPRAAHIEKGGISFIAQSGSAFTALCHNGCRLGFNLCVSSGNEMATTVADYMDWSLEQDDTRVIGLFLETVRDPRGFVTALEKAKRKQIPVVVLKIGKTPQAKAMALTHTGAMAGEHAAFQALFKRYGVIEVDDLDEMAPILMLLQSGRTVGDGKFAAAFESGGFRELVTDLAAELGVEFAEIETSTRTSLEEHLDPGLKAENPLDAWGSHHNFEARFQACMDLLMQDPNVAGGAFISNFRDGYYISEAIYQAVEEVSRQTEKPIALINCYADLANDLMCQRAHKAGIPIIDGSREGLLAFKRLFDYHRDQQAGTGEQDHKPLDANTVKVWKQKISSHPDDSIGEVEAMQMLNEFSIPVARNSEIDKESDLLTAADEIGYPLVIKTAGAGINHKTDVRGVFINIKTDTELVNRYRDLATRFGPRVIVARMIDTGVEISLGTVNDPQFGPLIMVAAGGVLVEILSDKAVSLCPVDAAEAEAMLLSLKANRLFQGLRGKAAINRKALVDTMVKLSKIALALRNEIAEIDINPVIANQIETIAVDALILRRGQTGNRRGKGSVFSIGET